MAMARCLTRAALVVSLAAGAHAALAQVTTPEPVPPEQVEPGPPVGAPGSGESLGEELTRSQGVITPPQGVDPGLVQEPPPAETTPMPVIPPPGSPGGDPQVQPR
jgi:hypothetical protein